VARLVSVTEALPGRVVAAGRDPVEEGRGSAGQGAGERPVGATRRKVPQKTDTSHLVYFKCTKMSLYIGNLPSDMRTHELEDIFKKYGKITFCESKIGRGFGFVDFADRRDAEEAIRKCDGMEIAGGRIRVEWARTPRRGPGNDYIHRNFQFK
jgi:RNA recognition motif-containing protein